MLWRELEILRISITKYFKIFLLCCALYITTVTWDPIWLPYMFWQIKFYQSTYLLYLFTIVCGCFCDKGIIELFFFYYYYFVYFYWVVLIDTLSTLFPGPFSRACDHSSLPLRVHSQKGLHLKFWFSVITVLKFLKNLSLFCGVCWCLWEGQGGDLTA